MYFESRTYSRAVLRGPFTSTGEEVLRLHFLSNCSHYLVSVHISIFNLAPSPTTQKISLHFFPSAGHRGKGGGRRGWVVWEGERGRAVSDGRLDISLVLIALWRDVRQYVKAAATHCLRSPYADEIKRKERRIRASQIQTKVPAKNPIDSQFGRTGADELGVNFQSSFLLSLRHIISVDGRWHGYATLHISGHRRCVPRHCLL